MSYTSYSPNEYALWLSQQFQRGNLHPYWATLGQLPLPQYPLPVPLNSRSASEPPTHQSQIPTAGFQIITTDTYPTGSMAMPYPTTSFPVQDPQAPVPHVGTSVPAYASFENNRRAAPHDNDTIQSGSRPSESQQVLPIRAVQQNHLPTPYETQPIGTHLTTIHPSLGVCVLVPLDQLRASAPPSAPPSSPNWSTVNNASHSVRDYDSTRVDRLRRRHSRSVTPFMRSMNPSPRRSPTLSPYLPSPSSSIAMTPSIRHRRHNTPEFVRSPGRFRGIGGFTPLRRTQSAASVPRVTREASISTVGTCSQCGGTVAGDSYEPFTNGSIVATPRNVVRDGALAGQGESFRGCGEGQEALNGGHGRFQATVEEVDE
ncbi:hypothetical protein KVR01_006961 [Diaporthe batatas]|uniref:uncharacterized protein n=1 Tax=Diaporthe batatas TaxID=748121 RepID=UPI001D05A4D9|nr:uncharacterized protein KVR01_006961 [Diaporthe batatas]KAG8163664.1 hypothetical protein KVR01_006961 [Diaporthe batatas]